jgi:hypothetical protein
MTDPNNSHAIDKLLRKAAGDPMPTDASRSHVESALSRAIRDAYPTRRPKRARWRWTAPALAGSLAVVLAVVLVLQVTRPSAAAAALSQIAVAADLIDPISIPSQSYAYTRSESTVLGVVPPDDIVGRAEPLVYLLPQTREAWIARTGIVQVSTTTHAPVFFSVEDETDYHDAGLDRVDRVDETITLAGTGLTSILDERDWPTNAGDLKTAIIDSLPEDSQQQRDAAIANLALALTAETSASPQLKAAALRLISTLDGVALTQRLRDGGGIFSIDYDQPQPTSLVFTIAGDGNLLGFTLTDLEGDPTLGIPPNTAIEDTNYQPTIIVTSLNTP